MISILCLLAFRFAGPSIIGAASIEAAVVNSI
jgi:hypothetical protein